MKLFLCSFIALSLIGCGGSSQENKASVTVSQPNPGTPAGQSVVISLSAFPGSDATTTLNNNTSLTIPTSFTVTNASSVAQSATLSMGVYSCTYSSVNSFTLAFVGCNGGNAPGSSLSLAVGSVVRLQVVSGSNNVVGNVYGVTQ